MEIEALDHTDPQFHREPSFARVALTHLLGGGALVALLLAGSCAARADWQNDPRPITWTRCSSTIAVGGTAQFAPAVAPTTPIRGYFLQNPSTATESLFFDVSGTASTTAGTSPELTAGQSVTFGPGTIFNGRVSVNAASPGHAYVCQVGQ